MSVDRFSNLLAREPDHPLFRFSLARALVADGRLEEALSELERCTQARPDWMAAHILLGETLLALDRPAEARPVLTQALSLAVAQEHEEPASHLRQLLARSPF